MKENELEQHLLGNLLRENSDFFKIPFLKAEHFSDESYGLLFSRMKEKFERGEPATPVTLAEFYAGEELKTIARMFALFEVNSTKHLAESLLRIFQKRETKKIIQKAAEELEKNEDTQSILSQATESLVKIQSGAMENMFVDSHTLAERITKSIGAKLPFYATGVAAIDESMLGGLFEGRSYCIAARPKAGKTMMLGTISGNLNDSGVKHLYVAAEMGSEQIFQRMIARRLGRSARAFISDNESKDFKNRVAAETVKISNNLIFLDAPAINFKQLKTSLEIAVYKHKIKGFILDYLQLVTGKEKEVNSAEHQLNVAQWIAEFCKKHSIWALYAAQLNRTGEVRGSDGIIMAADQVYFQHKITEGLYKNAVYLEQVASRYTEPLDIGSEERPLLEIHNTGTHISLIQQ